MDEFEDNFEPDLFNCLLNDPQYEIVDDGTWKSLAKKLEASQKLQCIKCTGHLRKLLIYYKEQIHCVVCFSKDYQVGQPFMTIDLTKKMFDESRWTLSEQLQIINSMNMLGVENCEQIAKNLQFTATTNSIEEYQRSFVQHKQNEEIKQTITQNKESWRPMYQSFTNALLLNEYQIVDHMIANLHEKSNPQQQNFLISYKQRADYEMEQIRKWIQKLSKDYEKNSLHPYDIEEQEQEISLSDIDIEDGSEEDEQLIKATTLLLKQVDEFIQKRQRMMERIRNSNNNIENTNKNHLIKKQLKKQRRFGRPPKKSTHKNKTKYEI